MYMELRLVSPEATITSNQREDMLTITDKAAEIKLTAEESMIAELLAQAVTSLDENNLEIFVCKLVWEYMSSERLKDLLGYMNSEQQEREVITAELHRVAQ